jgi:hypothetical protein
MGLLMRNPGELWEFPFRVTQRFRFTTGLKVGAMRTAGGQVRGLFFFLRLTDTLLLQHAMAVVRPEFLRELGLSTL